MITLVLIISLQVELFDISYWWILWAILMDIMWMNKK